MSGPRPYNPLVTASPPWREYLAALEDERFFEAHEILEAYWIHYRGADRDFYKGLIQAAAALHHAARGNAAGAAAIARRARELMAPYGPRHAGFDVGSILARLARIAA